MRIFQTNLLFILCGVLLARSPPIIGPLSDDYLWVLKAAVTRGVDANMFFATAINYTLNAQLFSPQISSNLTDIKLVYEALTDFSSGVTNLDVAALALGGYVMCFLNNDKLLNLAIFDGNLSLVQNKTISWISGNDTYPWYLLALSNGSFIHYLYNTKGEIYFSIFEKNAEMLQNLTCAVCNSSISVVNWPNMKQIDNNTLSVVYTAMISNSQYLYPYLQIIDFSGNAKSITPLSCGSDAPYGLFTDHKINPISKNILATWISFLDLSSSRIQTAYSIIDQAGEIQTNCTYFEPDSNKTNYNASAQILMFSNGTAFVYWALKDANGSAYVQRSKVFNNGSASSTYEYIYTSSSSPLFWIVTYDDDSYLFLFKDWDLNQIFSAYYEKSQNLLYSSLNCYPSKYVLSSDQSSCFQKISGCISMNWTDGSCLNCSSALVLSASKFYCPSPIENCLGVEINESSNNAYCLQCDTTTVMSDSGQACVEPISNCLNYSDDGNCTECQSDWNLTLSNQLCAPSIDDCIAYNDDFTCSECQSGFNLTIKNQACATPIENCLIYWDNKTCRTCESNNALSISFKKCVKATVSGCSRYQENGDCWSCTDTKALTISNKTCVRSITNCVEYQDDGTCLMCLNETSLIDNNSFCAVHIPDCLNLEPFSGGKCAKCNNSKILTKNHFGCASPIDNCSQYSDNDLLCDSCNFSLIVTEGKVACAESITNCQKYSDNKNCSLCSNSSFILTTGKRVCAPKIDYCLNYSDDAKCMLCDSEKVLSISSSFCANIIRYCLTYSDNGVCQSCITGADLSNDNSICSLNYTKLALPTEQNKNVISNILVNIPSQIGDKYLQKAKEQNILIKHNYSNYDLDLDNDSIIFTNWNAKVIVLPVQKNNLDTDFLNLTLNVSSLDSGYYQVTANLVFTKRETRLLENSSTENLPEMFVVIYQDPQQYYISSDDDIQQDSTKSSDNESSGFNAEIFAIILSIFIFLAILFLVIIVCLKKGSKKRTPLKSVDFEPVPSIIPANQDGVVIDEELKNRDRGGLSSSPVSTNKELMIDSINQI